MKKSLVILNVILIAAVAGLYVLYFTGNTKEEAQTASVSRAEGFTELQKIAFVNIDSLLVDFEMFKDYQDELQAKQEESEAKLSTKSRAYEKDATDFQEKVSKMLVTRATAAQMEQNLMQQQQELLNLRDQLTMELQEEEAVKNRSMLDYIMKFLDEYTEDKNYSYILSESFGGPLLYTEDALNITGEVLAALNKKYLSEKK